MKKIMVIGATSAIGKAVLEQYAKLGNELFLVGRDKVKLAELERHLLVLGAKTCFCACLDIAEIEQHITIINTALSRMGRLDIVLIAPGVLPGNQDIEQQLADFHINAACTIALCERIGNLLANQGGGCMAVISSVAGDRGRQSNYWYGSAKGAVSIFLQGLRNKLFKYGVSILTIKPGFIDTPMTTDFKKGALWATPEQIAPQIISAIQRGKSTIYVPSFWRYIMFIVRSIPEFIFKRMKL